MTAKRTVTLPEDLMALVDELVAAGLATSRSRFVAEALRHELTRVEKSRIDAIFYELATDPDQLSQEALMVAEFELADAEAFRLGEAAYRAQSRKR